MRKFFRISEVFSRLSGNRADSFAERIRGRKNGRNRFEERRLRLEQLEERQLLAVTAVEYDAIRQAFDFGLAEDQAETDVIELTDLSVDALQTAIFQAGQTSKNDLIVIRTGAIDAVLELGNEPIRVCNDAKTCGTLSIVAWNEGTDAGNLNLTISAGIEAFDVAQGTELQTRNITVNGAAVSTGTKSVSVKAGESAEVNYLVIFSGGESPEKNTSIYYDEVVRLYNIARQEYSVKAENIYILYADGIDPAEDQNIAGWEGATPILINSDMSFATRTGGKVYSASYDNFLTVMGQVGKKMDGNDHLLLFTADHGYGTEEKPEENDAAIVGWESELISGNRFAQAVFSVTAGYVTLVETQCFSGGILDKIIDPVTKKSLNPNIDEADAVTKWYGMAAANYYESANYSYDREYDSTYEADIIVPNSEVSFATAFLDAFEEGGDYALGVTAFEEAKTNNPFTADEKYRNNAGEYTEGFEHPWGAGATFRIFTDWRPEPLANPVIALDATGASTAELVIIPVANASGYTVEWSVDSDFGDYERMEYDEAGAYEIANLKDNTKYYFRVKAEGSERYTDSAWTFDTVITKTYKLPSIDNAHFVVTDGNDESNQLYGVGVEIAWQCGDFGTIADSFTVLADKDGKASLTLTGAGDWGDHFNWLIDGENNGGYWTIDGNSATWSNIENIESPKREFTFVVWNDKNNNDLIDSGEDYNSFTVSIQWANISICVDQPFPGSDEVYFFEYDEHGEIKEYSAGHGFWDNRTTEALLNSAIVGNYFNKFANTSEGYGSTQWGIEAIDQLVETGNFICPGRTQLAPNGDTSLARWSNVDAYKTFTIKSLSGYLNLLQYNKEMYENPPTYVQVETAEIGEMQCMIAAMNALRAAGFTVESYPQDDLDTTGWGRSDATEIIDYVNANNAAFDINGDGEVDGADVTLFKRYALGKRGESLVMGLDMTGWNRDAAEAEQYIIERIEDGTFDINRTLDADNAQVIGTFLAYRTTDILFEGYEEEDREVWTRNTPDQFYTYFDQLMTDKEFDANGDNVCDETDAVLYTRYLAGERGEKLVEGFDDMTGWTRTTGQEIAAFIEARFAEKDAEENYIYDINGDGDFDNDDIILMTRIMEFYTGETLMEGLDTDGWSRTGSYLIWHLNDQYNDKTLDIDGDGKMTMGVDAELIGRYAHGLRGAELIAGLTITGPRNTAASIEAYFGEIIDNGALNINGTIDPANATLLANCLAGAGAENLFKSQATGLYDFEYEWTTVLAPVPGTTDSILYNGTSPAHVGQDLVRDGGQYTFDEFGVYTEPFNGHDLDDQNFPQPKANGSYSVSDMRAFLASLKERDPSDVSEAERAKLQHYLLTLSSYTVDETAYSPEQNVLYLDFGQFEATGYLGEGNEGYVQGWTRYTLDYDDTRERDEDGFYDFTFQELVAMYEAWVTTSEDFAPFNINVTLDFKKFNEASADVEKLHALIGGTEADWLGHDDNQRPITVFGQNMFYVFASGKSDGVQIGNLISHEAGHSLGLAHWSQLGVELYSGNDEWSPIMGKTESGKLTQWSRGEYPNAINGADGKAAEDQNDIEILIEKLGLRPDENNVSIYTATLIDLAQVTSSTAEIALAEGIIGGYWNGNPAKTDVEAGTVTTVFDENDDADYYMFELTDGQAYHFNVGGILADGMTNLDVRVNIYNAAGELLQTYDNTDSLNVGFTFGDAAGIYYLSVMGTGKKTEIDGIYSDYGSLGMYDIRVKKGTILRVNTTSDIVNENDNVLSLREAVQTVNALGDDEIAFIYFENGGTYTLAGEQLALTHSVNMLAEGKDVIINGSGLSRVMSIGSSTGKQINVKIDGVNITGGSISESDVGGAGVYVYANAKVEMNNVTIYGNRSQQTTIEVIEEEGTAADGEEPATVTVVTEVGFGGGVLNYGTLTMTGSSVSNNSARNGGGIANYGIFTADRVTLLGNNGHGVYVAGGMAAMDNSTLERNAAADYGGGICVNAGTAVLTETVLRGNTSVSCGGGAFVNENGSLTLDHVMVSGNSSTGHGGGIDVSGGTLTIVDTTVERNSAFDYGGGISAHNAGNQSGNDAAIVTIVDSTISFNRVNGIRTYDEEGVVTQIGRADGGGLAAIGAAVFTVTGSTIEENRVDNRGVIVEEIFASTAVGGGVYANGSGVVMTFFDSEISTNAATGLTVSGGGFYIAGGADVTLSNTAVRKHQTTGSGAGIYLSGAATKLTVNQTSYIEHNEIYTENTTTGGAGIFADQRATVFIDKSYIQNNAISSTGEFACGGGLALYNRSYGVITDSEFFMNGLFVGRSDVWQPTAVAYGGAIYSDSDGSAPNSNLYGLELYNSRIMANIVKVYATDYADGRGGGVYTLGGRLNGNYVVQNTLYVSLQPIENAAAKGIAYGGGLYAGDEVYSTVIAENSLYLEGWFITSLYSGGAGVSSTCQGMHQIMNNCTVTDNMGIQRRSTIVGNFGNFFEYVAGYTAVTAEGAGDYNPEYRLPDSYSLTHSIPNLNNNIIIRNSQSELFPMSGTREQLFNYLSVADGSSGIYSTILGTGDGFDIWNESWRRRYVQRFVGNAAIMARWERYLYEYWQPGITGRDRMELSYLCMYNERAYSDLTELLENQLEQIDEYIEFVQALDEELPEEERQPDGYFDAYKEELLADWRGYWWGYGGMDANSLIRVVDSRPYHGYESIWFSWVVVITPTPDSHNTYYETVYTNTGNGNLDVSHELWFYFNPNSGYYSCYGDYNIVGMGAGQFSFSPIYGSENIEFVETGQSFFLEYGKIPISSQYTNTWVLGDYHINPYCTWAMSNAVDTALYDEISSHGLDLKDAGGAERLYDWYGTGGKALDRGAYEMKPDSAIAGYDGYTVINFDPDAMVVTTLWDYVNPNDGVVSLREALGYYDADGRWVDGYANDDTTITFADYLMGGGIYYTPLTVFMPYQADTATFTVNRGITIDARNKKEDDSIGIYIDIFGRLNTDNSKESTDTTAAFEFVDSDKDQSITLLGFDMQWVIKIIDIDLRSYGNRYQSSNDTAIINYSDTHSNHTMYDTDYIIERYTTNIGGIVSSVTNGYITIDGCKIHDFYKNGLQFDNDNREVEFKEYYTIQPYEAGAVLNHEGDGTTVTFYNTQVYKAGIKNYDEIKGGAVYIKDAGLNILGSSFEECFADALYEAYGGAVYVENGHVTVDATEKSETSESYRSDQGDDDPADPVGPDDPACDPTVCYEYEYTYSRFEKNRASADYTTAYNPIAVYAYVTDHYPRDIRSGFDPTEDYVRDALAQGGALCVKCTDDAPDGYDVTLTGVTFLENEVRAVANNYEIEKTLNATAGGGAVFVSDRIDLTVTAADNENKRVDTLPQITSFIGNQVSSEVRSTEFIATDWGKKPLARAAGGAVGMAGNLTFFILLEGAVFAQNSVEAVSEWGIAEVFGGGLQVCNLGIIDSSNYLYDASDGTIIEFETLFVANSLSADGRFGAYAFGGGMSNYPFAARNNVLCDCDPAAGSEMDDESCDPIGGGEIWVDNSLFNNNAATVKSSEGYAEAFGGGVYCRGALNIYTDDWYKSGRDKYEQQFNVLFNGNSLTADGNATKNCSPDTLAAAAAGGGLYIAEWQSGCDNPFYSTYELENIQADNNTVRVISTNKDICQTGDLIAQGGGVAIDDPYVAFVTLNGSSVSGNTISAVSNQVKDNRIAHDNYDYQETRAEGAGLYVRDAEQVDVFESRAAGNTGIATAAVFGEANGGGIYVVSSAHDNADEDVVRLNISRGRFIDNRLEATINASGGGIYYVGIDSMNLSDSSFTGENTVKAVNALGGGLYAETEGTVTIGCGGEETLVFEYAIISAQQSRVYMNSVDGQDKSAAFTANGGGLYVTEGEKLDITDATGICGNYAGTDGGGIYAAALTGELKIAVGSWLRDNRASERGGAIYSVDNGDLHIDNIVFDNNSAGLDGGAIYSKRSHIGVNLGTFTRNSAGRYGGAIYTVNSEGIVINASLFNKNTAVMRGGAIYNNTRKLTVSVTQFVGNSATDINGYGGAICNLGYEQAEITDSNFRQNTAFGSGGAIYNYMASDNNTAGLSIVQTDFTENKAGYSAAGETADYGNGGAIYNIGGNLTMTGDIEAGNLLTNNTASQSGGGIYNSRGNVEIVDYSIKNNSADIDGGAIYTRGNQQNTLLISANNIGDAQIIDNQAGRDGGAIYTRVEKVDIVGYTITSNDAGNNGGAVWYRAEIGQEGDLTISGQGDAISHNKAGENGGAFWLYDVKLNIDDCDFIENNALEGAGGAIWIFNNNGQELKIAGDFLLNTAGENGGAIYAESKAGQKITLTGNLGDMLLSETRGNDAGAYGGGLYALAASTQAVTVTGNVIGNTAGLSGGGVYAYSTGKVTGKFNKSNIQNNSAGGDGGALWFANSTGTNVNLTVDSDKTKVISANTAGLNGGAIYHVGGKLLVREYDLKNNTAAIGSGGAIYHEGGDFFLNYKNVASAKVTDPATKFNVTGNSAGSDGGAIYHTGGKFGTVALNAAGNSANGSGGAFYLDETSEYTYIWLSDISNNQAAASGGGIYQGTGTKINLYNVLVSDNRLTAKNGKGAGVYNGASKGQYFSTTIAGNSAAGDLSQGGGVYVKDGTNTFTNSIVALNEAAEGAQVYNDGGVINVSYSISSAELNWQALDEHSLNYDDDPENPLEIFVDPDGGNYRILKDCAVAGKGDKDKDKTDYDLDGKPRLKNQTISMGAYENYDNTPTPKTQRVYGYPSTYRVCTGNEVVLDIWHDASTTVGDPPKMTGVTSLTLRVHYNSKILKFNGESLSTKPITEADLIIVGGQWFHDYEDTANDDNDSRTDRYIQVSWNNENGWGSDELAKKIDLMNLAFTANNLSVSTATQVNFTSKYLTEGYEFLSQSIVVNVISPNFDVDDNGTVDLNDVSMIIRYFDAEQKGTLENLDLSDLIDQIGAQRETTAKVAAYIDAYRSIFNIDGSRGTPGFTESVDGELLRRYFSGYRDCPLVDNIYFVNASRKTPSSIETYIEHYTYGEETMPERPDTPYHVVTGDISTDAVPGQSVIVSVSHKLYDTAFTSIATEEFIQGVIDTEYQESGLMLFDINGDGLTDWVDAELFTRYLDGKRGIELVDDLGRTQETWTRYQSTEIIKYLKANKAEFDADGNDEINDVDSTLFARYIDGKRGTELTAGFDKTKWGRSIGSFTSKATEEYIQGVIVSVSGNYGTFDINGDGVTDGTDALLLTRYVDGLRWEALVEGMGDRSDWGRAPVDKIQEYIQSKIDDKTFDADGNGEINSVDSTLFARYIDGKRGRELTEGFDKTKWGRPTEDSLTASSLSLRIHYNSELFRFDQTASEFVRIDDQVFPPTANPHFVDLADTQNADDDLTTNRYVLVTWNDPDGEWTANDFEKIFQAVFTVEAYSAKGAHFNLTAADMTANYRFGGWDADDNTVVDVEKVEIDVDFVDTAQVNFDIDKNPNAFYLVNVENDINLMYRFVYATEGKREEPAPEEWPEVVKGLTKYKEANAIRIVKKSLDLSNDGIFYMLDIDGNGQFTAQDVEILERYLDGFIGYKLIEDIPTERTAAEVTKHIEIYLPAGWNTNALAMYSFADGSNDAPKTLSEEIDPAIQGILLYVNAAESAMTLNSLALSSVTAPVTVGFGSDADDERFAVRIAEIDLAVESFWDSFVPTETFEETEISDDGEVSALDEAILDFNWEE